MMTKQTISSYDSNQLDDIAVDDDRSSSGNSSNNNNNSSDTNKWIGFICKFIYVLSTIIKFCFPLIITIAILSYDSYVIGAIVGFGLVISKILVLDLFLYKMGKIQNWPNKFDMIASALYASFLLERLQLQGHYIIVYSILTASIGVAWLFGYPIGRAIIVSDKVGDVVTFDHPVVIHFIQLTSGVMLCTFSLNLMLSIVAAVAVDYDHDHGEKEKAIAFLFDCCILLVNTADLIFISCYCFHFNTNIERIAAKYEKEISKQMDNHKHHHHPNNNNNDEMTTTNLEMQAIIIQDNYIE